MITPFGAFHGGVVVAKPETFALDEVLVHFTDHRVRKLLFCMAVYNGVI
jgi:hypothetical protein